MWLAPVVYVALGMSLVGADPLPASPDAWLPAPIATRQTHFAIPFRIEAPGTRPGTTRQVQLHVSNDRGATWTHYSNADPKREHFVFRAGGEGEYLFLVRTLDHAGQPHPPGPPRPEMRVVVDRTPPELKLEAWQAPGGRITAQWRIHERLLDEDSLQIQYQTRSGRRQTVAVDRQAMVRSGSLLTGQVSWWPADAPERIEIRAQVADKAGNPQVSHAQVDMRMPATVRHTAGAGRHTANAGRGQWQAAKPRARSHPSGVTTAPEYANTPRQSAPQDPVGPYPQTTVASSVNQSPNYQYPRTETPDGQGASGYRLATTVPANPPIGNRFAMPNESAGGAQAADTTLPLRMVRSRLVDVEYAIEPNSSGDIRQVELWGTRDDGRTWESYALDNDRRSPITAHVNGEGVYGFRVVVQGRNDTENRSPQPGEQPQARVGVDLTDPVAKLTSVQQQGDRLMVCWDAADWKLAEGPIDLAYSPYSYGPWTPIASKLDNTGSYAWQLPADVSPRIYLRVKVRDEAGNTTVFERAEPISLDTAAIGNAIRADSAERPAPRRYFLR